jgi:hypothetical protein
MKKLVILLLLILIFFIIIFTVNYIRFNLLNKELHSKKLLNLQDVGPKYHIINFRERNINDVSDFSKTLGWKKGYLIEFQKGTSVQDAVFVLSYNSEYPKENISKAISKENTFINSSIGKNGEIWIGELVENPENIVKVGENEIIFKSSSVLNNTPLIDYRIIFIKGNTLELVSVSGSEKYVSINDFIKYTKTVEQLI